jgi:hypothetical protein
MKVIGQSSGGDRDNIVSTYFCNQWRLICIKNRRDNDFVTKAAAECLEVKV